MVFNIKKIDRIHKILIALSFLQSKISIQVFVTKNFQKL